MTYSPRLNAVLRAGQSQRLMGASYSGKPGDNSISYRNAPTGLKTPSLSKAKTMPSLSKAKTTPSLSKSKTTPATPAGSTAVKGPAPGKKVLKNDQGDQAFQKSSEAVNDLIRNFKEGQKAQEEALRRARAEGEECAKRRVAAIDKYRDTESKAARETVEKLERMLKEVEASRDSLQNASEASIAKLDKIMKEGGESSKQVDEMQKLIATLQDEKASIQTELDNAKTNSDKARDAATAHEEAELAKLTAEWQLKLDKAEKTAAEGDVVSSKKTKEYASKLEKATEELEAKTKEIKGLEKGAYEHDSKFRKAAKAACEALSEYTKDNPEEAFRQTMESFVTSAPAVV